MALARKVNRLVLKREKKMDVAESHVSIADTVPMSLEGTLCIRRQVHDLLHFMLARTPHSDGDSPVDTPTKLPTMTSPRK
jgi:hypothetical protein